MQYENFERAIGVDCSLMRLHLTKIVGILFFKSIFISPTNYWNYRVKKSKVWAFLNTSNPSCFLDKTLIFFQYTASVQFSSVAQSCPTPYDSMNCSMPGLPVHHQLLEFIQTHIHWVGDAIQPSHPLLSPSPPTPNPSQHQSLFQWTNSSHDVAKVLEFQL